MKIIRDAEYLDARDKGAVAAIGNFDGVHRGHQHAIDAVCAKAAASNLPSGIVTFEPHPRRFFSPDAPPFRLMNAAARAHRLAQCGIERLYELPFDAALAGLSPEAFAHQIIVKGLGLHHVMVGADFCFGKGRKGTAEDLAAYGAAFGFGVSIIPLLHKDKDVVSSTRIRAALSAGQPELAAEFLGHWHRVEAVVEHGEKRGRQLGYPTANLSLGELHRPRFGIYAVLVDVRDGPHQGRYHGVASLGERPTFGQYQPNLEVHLFDFRGDLYGSTLSVALIAYQRGEVKFESIAALIAQMDADSAKARQILSAL